MSSHYRRRILSPSTRLPAALGPVDPRKLQSTSLREDMAPQEAAYNQRDQQMEVDAARQEREATTAANKAEREAESAAKKEATSARRLSTFAQQQQLDAQGIQHRQAPDGSVQVRTDPMTGKTATNDLKGPMQYDQQGRAFQMQRVDGKATQHYPDAKADIGANPDDPNDPYLYRKNSQKTWDTIDPKEGLISPDPAIKQASADHLLAQERRALSKEGAILHAELKAPDHKIDSKRLHTARARAAAGNIFPEDADIIAKAEATEAKRSRLSEIGIKSATLGGMSAAEYADSRIASMPADAINVSREKMLTERRQGINAIRARVEEEEAAFAADYEAFRPTTQNFLPADEPAIRQRMGEFNLRRQMLDAKKESFTSSVNEFNGWTQKLHTAAVTKAATEKEAKAAARASGAAPTADAPGAPPTWDGLLANERASIAALRADPATQEQATVREKWQKQIEATDPENASGIDYMLRQSATEAQAAGVRDFEKMQAAEDTAKQAQVHVLAAMVGAEDFTAPSPTAEQYQQSEIHQAANFIGKHADKPANYAPWGKLTVNPSLFFRAAEYTAAVDGVEAPGRAKEQAMQLLPALQQGLAGPVFEAYLTAAGTNGAFRDSLRKTRKTIKNGDPEFPLHMPIAGEKNFAESFKTWDPAQKVRAIEDFMASPGFSPTWNQIALGASGGMDAIQQQFYGLGSFMGIDGAQQAGEEELRQQQAAAAARQTNGGNQFLGTLTQGGTSLGPSLIAGVLSGGFAAGLGFTGEAAASAALISSSVAAGGQSMGATMIESAQAIAAEENAGREHAQPISSGGLWKARAISAASGALTAGFTQLGGYHGTGKLFTSLFNNVAAKNLPAVKQSFGSLLYESLKGYGIGGLKEAGIEEVPDQASQNLLASLTFEPSREFTEGLVDTAAVAFLLGFGVNAATDVARISGEKLNAAKLQKNFQVRVDLGQAIAAKQSPDIIADALAGTPLEARTQETTDALAGFDARIADGRDQLAAATTKAAKLYSTRQLAQAYGQRAAYVSTLRGELLQSYTDAAIAEIDATQPPEQDPAGGMASATPAAATALDKDKARAKALLAVATGKADTLDSAALALIDLARDPKGAITAATGRTDSPDGVPRVSLQDGQLIISQGAIDRTGALFPATTPLIGQTESQRRAEIAAQALIAAGQQQEDEQEDTSAPAAAPAAPALSTFEVEVEGINDPIAIQATDEADARKQAMAAYKGRIIRSVTDSGPVAKFTEQETKFTEQETKFTEQDPTTGDSSATAPTVAENATVAPSLDLTPAGITKAIKANFTGEPAKDQAQRFVSAGKALSAELSKWQAAFPGGIKANAYSGSGGVQADNASEDLTESVPVFLSLDFPALAENINTMDSEAAGLAWLSRVMLEEVIHSVAIDLEAKGIINLTAIWDQLPAPLQAQAIASYPRSRSQRNSSHELFRMWVQYRLRGDNAPAAAKAIFTEQTFPAKALAELAKALDALLTYFRDLAKTLRTQGASADTIARVTEAGDLIEAGVRALQAKKQLVPKPAQAEPAAAPPAAKPARATKSKRLRLRSRYRPDPETYPALAAAESLQIAPKPPFSGDSNASYNGAPTQAEYSTRQAKDAVSRLYSAGSTVRPDTAAHAFAEAIGSDPAGFTEFDMWQAIRDELRILDGAQSKEATAQDAIDDQERQALDFSAATASGKIKVEAAELAIGEVLDIEGEQVTVKAIEKNDAGTITTIVLQDGKRFGRMEIDGSATLYVERWDVESPDWTVDPPEAPAAGNETATRTPESNENASQVTKAGQEIPAPLTLETQTDAQIAAEKARADAKKKIDQLQNKPLKGNAGDMTPDLLAPGTEDNALFTRPPDKVDTAPQKAANPGKFTSEQNRKFKTWLTVAADAPSDLRPGYDGVGRLMETASDEAPAFRDWLLSQKDLRPETRAALESFGKEAPTAIPNPAPELEPAAPVVQKDKLDPAPLSNSDSAIKAILSDLDRDDFQAASSRLDKLNKSDLEQVLSGLGLPAWNAQTAKELRARFSDAAPRMTKSALESARKTRAISTAERALATAKQKQQSHLDGYLGHSMSDDAIKALTEEEMRNPQGSGKSAVAKSWQHDVDKAQKALDALMQSPAPGEAPAAAKGKRPLTPGAQALKDVMDAALGGAINSQPIAQVYNQAFPKALLLQLVQAAQTFEAEGNDSPEKLAAELASMGPAYRAFSGAIFSAMGSVNSSLQGVSPDWQAIYAALDKPPQINDTPPQDDLTTRTPLEPDRGDAGTGNGSRQNSLSPEPGSTGPDGRPLGPAGDRSGDTLQGDLLPPDGAAPPAGERGNRGAGQSNPGTAQRPAGGQQPGGSSDPDADGVEADARGENHTHSGLVLPGVARTVAQGSADGIRGLVAIKKSAPALTPEQAGDVAFMETRLLENGKAGVLLTNGTGTGKTFSGLGFIKRTLDRGAKHILIVAPSDKIGSDWVSTARDHFQITDAAQLTDTKDTGGKNRVVVTTYANVGLNPGLVTRPWDLVVTDESHYLSASKAGDSTLALNAIRALTQHPKGSYTRAELELPEVTAGLESERLKTVRDLDKINSLATQLSKRAELIRSRQPEVKDRPKLVMLSATPFAYHFSLDYAEGYLFDHGAAPTSTSYNTPSARDRFYIENLGYRMRIGKLTQPENAAATGLLERLFAQNLMKSGAMSGRSLQVPFDYGREFVQTESALGQKLDDIFKAINDNPRFSPLSQFLGIGDYLDRRYLLEGLKAKEAVPRIQKHLAMGRKVVVFHDYKQGGSENPLRGDRIPKGLEVSVYINGKHVLINVQEEYENLRRMFPDFAATQRALDSLASPIELISRAFPDAGIFNGDASTKKRRAIVKEFNTSGGKMNVVLVQRASGKEGISLHDQDGKHQRVFIDLGIPGRPTDSIQSEGRIYRHGVQSDAVVEYLTTGTNFERWTFAQTIAQRASTAENLAMGENARSLLQAFSSGYDEAAPSEPSLTQGKGGKLRDAARESGHPFDNAVALYYTNQKKTSRTKSAEGSDYFATPEPVGFKMVEWAGIRAGDKALEPSGGHGAIARFFPDYANRHAVEPSMELAGRLALNAPDTTIHPHSFENFSTINKFDAVVMNAPFGTAGKLAMDHLIKAVSHLRDGGRVVALIPMGSSMEKRFTSWYEEQQGVFMAAEILLPPSTFGRAGTSVSTRIVILDKTTAEDAPQMVRRDFTDAEDVKTLFERMKDTSVPARPEPAVKRTIAEAVMEVVTEKATPRKESAPAGPTEDFAAADFLHTKTRKPIFVAKIVRRLSSAEYSAAKARATRQGGHYSSFNGAGAIAGFHFDSAENRDGFLGTPSAPLQSQSPGRIIKQAEITRLQKLIDSKYESGKLAGIEDMEADLETLLEAADTQLTGRIARDAEYMAAVQSGDVARHSALEEKHNAGTITAEETAEAQGIVDAAAEAAFGAKMANASVVQTYEAKDAKMYRKQIAFYEQKLAEVPTDAEVREKYARERAVWEARVKNPDKPDVDEVVSAIMAGVAAVSNPVEFYLQAAETERASAQRDIDKAKSALQGIPEMAQVTQFVTSEPFYTKVYHGTPFGRLDEFNDEVLGAFTGAPSAKLAHFFAGTPKVAETYFWDSANLLPHKGAAKLNAEQKRELMDAIRESREELSDNEVADLAYELFEVDYDSTHIENVMHEVFVHLKNPLVADFKGEEYREESFREVLERAAKGGHDGAVLANTHDAGPNSDFDDIGAPTNVVAVLSQDAMDSLGGPGRTRATIKSADPFTGVPLSQRFNPASASILQSQSPGAILRRLGVDTAEINARTEQDAAGFPIGDPERSLGMGVGSANDDIIRATSDLYAEEITKETRAQWLADALAMLAADYEGTVRRVMRIGYQGGSLSPEENIAAQLLTEQESRKPMTKTQRQRLQLLVWSYKLSGTEQARGMNARQDPFKTKAERHREALAKGIFMPPPEVRKAIEAAPTAAAKAKILEADQKRIDEIIAALAKMGVTLEDLLNGDRILVARRKEMNQTTLAKVMDAQTLSLAMEAMDATSSFADIAKKRGTTAEAAEAARDEAFAKMEAALRARFQMASRAAGAIQSQSIGDDPWVDFDFAGMVGMSPAEVDAEIARMMQSLGWHPKSHQGKRKTVRRKPPVQRIPQPPTSQSLEDYAATPMGRPQRGEQPRLGPLTTADDSIPPGPGQVWTRPARQQDELGLGLNLPVDMSIIIGADMADVNDVYRNMRIVSAAGSSVLDMMIEFWIHNLLSGPVTQFKNLASNLLFGSWNLVAKRAMEATLNLIWQNDQSASFTEFREIWKALAPAWSRGLRMMSLAWDTEADHFAHEVLNQQMELIKTGPAGQHRKIAIGGTFGRFVRGIGGRPLMALDGFAKGLFGTMEAAAHAYRIAKAEVKAGKIPGDGLQDRMQSLVYDANNPEWAASGSPAWIAAVRQAEQSAFQQELDSDKNFLDAIPLGIIKMTQSPSVFIKLCATLLFPYTKTPYNVYREGIRRSPLGATYLAYQILNGGMVKIKGGKITTEMQAQFITTLSEQIFGMSAMMLLKGAVEGDDDDWDKFFLITGSAPKGRPARELQERAFGGAYVVKIGRTVIPYGGIEPVATVLGTMADFIRSAKSGGTWNEKASTVFHSVKRGAMDKTFLSGIKAMGQLVGMDETDGGPDVVQRMRRFALTAIVPNLIRQPLRNSDSRVPEYATNEWWYDPLPLPAGTTGKVDPGSGEEKQRTGNMASRIFIPSAIQPEASVHPVDRVLLAWNQAHPSDTWSPGKIPRSRDFFDGARIALNPQSLHYLSTRSGTLARKALAGLPLKPTKEDMETIESAYRDARSQAWEEIKYRKPETLGEVTKK